MTTKRKRSAVSNRNATSELSDGPADLLGRFVYEWRKLRSDVSTACVSRWFQGPTSTHPLTRFVLTSDSHGAFPGYARLPPPMTRKFDKQASEAIATAVREIENQTDAEIVIVIRGRSGPYRHADYLCGSLLAFVGLLFFLFSPFAIHEWLVAIEVILLFVLGTFLSSRWPFLRRLLTSKKFRENAARQGAAAMFYEAGIANTRAENGLLIYVSLLERQIEIFADRGVLKAMPPLEWNTSIHELKNLANNCEPDKLVASLKRLGKVLAAHMPATGENPNELVDGPRIELK